MKKKVIRWWQNIKKQRLMGKFCAASTDEEKQREILSKLSNYELDNPDFWLLFASAANKTLANELQRKILFNGPDENDLFYLITLSDDKDIVRESFEKFEQNYGLNKKFLFICFQAVGNDEVALGVFNRFKVTELSDDELYGIIRVAKSELVAYRAFQILHNRLLDAWLRSSSGGADDEGGPTTYLA